MSKEPSELGPLLASARRQKKLTLRAVEGKTGVSNAYLSQLETGKIRSPSPVILRKLSDLYGISYRATLELAGYPPPEDPSIADLSARMGPVTSEEAEELAKHLKYLRSTQNRRNR